ncbi:manganese efflux pump [Mycoplasmatota bacterium]|nr:manganese efflux pump [Mycoplasmatota bacterium]
MLFIYISIGIFLSIDAILICTVYGFNLKKNDITRIILPVFIGVMHILFPIVFGIVVGLVKDYVDSYARFISATIFFYLGIQMIRTDSETEICLTRSIINSLLLAFGVSIDSIVLGLSLGISQKHHNLYYAGLIFGIISFSLSYLSLNRIPGLKKIQKLDLQYVSGGFFILLAVLSFFRIL